MNTKLDQLLADIDPERTIEPAFRGADAALNTYPMLVGRIEAWPSFEDSMGRFWRHLQKHIVGLRGDGSGFERFHQDFAAQVLRKEYGPSGYAAAFEFARTGNEGGLYSVLKKLANRIATETATNWIAMAVDGWWRRLSLEEQLAVPDEYVARFGHLLPSELTEHSAARIRVGIRGVLKEHPWLVQRHGRVGR